MDGIIKSTQIIHKMDPQKSTKVLKLRNKFVNEISMIKNLISKEGSSTAHIYNIVHYLLLLKTDHYNESLRQATRNQFVPPTHARVKDKQCPKSTSSARDCVLALQEQIRKSFVDIQHRTLKTYSPIRTFQGELSGLRDKGFYYEPAYNSGESSLATFPGVYGQVNAFITASNSEKNMNNFVVKSLLCSREKETQLLNTYGSAATIILPNILEGAHEKRTVSYGIFAKDEKKSPFYWNNCNKRESLLRDRFGTSALLDYKFTWGDNDLLDSFWNYKGQSYIGAYDLLTDPSVQLVSGDTYQEFEIWWTEHMVEKALRFYYSIASEYKKLFIKEFNKKLIESSNVNDAHDRLEALVALPVTKINQDQRTKGRSSFLEVVDTSDSVERSTIANFMRKNKNKIDTHVLAEFEVYKKILNVYIKGLLKGEQAQVEKLLKGIQYNLTDLSTRAFKYSEYKEGFSSITADPKTWSIMSPEISGASEQSIVKTNKVFSEIKGRLMAKPNKEEITKIYNLFTSHLKDELMFTREHIIVTGKASREIEDNLIQIENIFKTSALTNLDRDVEVDAELEKRLNQYRQKSYKDLVDEYHVASGEIGEPNARYWMNQKYNSLIIYKTIHAMRTLSNEVFSNYHDQFMSGSQFVPKLRELADPE